MRGESGAVLLEFGQIWHQQLIVTLIDLLLLLQLFSLLSSDITPAVRPIKENVHKLKPVKRWHCWVHRHALICTCMNSNLCSSEGNSRQRVPSESPVALRTQTSLVNGLMTFLVNAWMFKASMDSLFSYFYLSMYVLLVSMLIWTFLFTYKRNCSLGMLVSKTFWGSVLMTTLRSRC